MRATGQLGVFTVAVLLAGRMQAQPVPSGTADNSSGAAAHPWEFSLTVDGYMVPHAQFYVSPIFTADRNWLHLEARYNYENLNTGSLWIGRNFSVGRTWVLEAKPMVGGVFGNTAGIAPGYAVSLTYKKLELSSTGEYLFDLRDRSASFFYSWPQLTYSPRDWLRVGLVAQRTKAYQTSLDVQRGVLVGFSHKSLNFTTYIFNAGWTQPTVVFEVSASF